MQNPRAEITLDSHTEEQLRLFTTQKATDEMRQRFRRLDFHEPITSMVSDLLTMRNATGRARQFIWVFQVNQAFK